MSIWCTFFSTLRNLWRNQGCPCSYAGYPGDSTDLARLCFRGCWVVEMIDSQFFCFREVTYNDVNTSFGRIWCGSHYKEEPKNDSFSSLSFLLSPWMCGCLAWDLWLLNPPCFLENPDELDDVMGCSGDAISWAFSEKRSFFTHFLYPSYIAK